MKSNEQLLELSKNPYYNMTPDEKSQLDAFLSKKSEQKTPAKNNTGSSEKNIPATVLNKNVVKKETGTFQVINNVVDDKTSESEAVEEIVHPDAVK